MTKLEVFSETLAPKNLQNKFRALFIVTCYFPSYLVFERPNHKFEKGIDDCVAMSQSNYVFMTVDMPSTRSVARRRNSNCRYRYFCARGSFFSQLKQPEGETGAVVVRYL